MSQQSQRSNHSNAQAASRPDTFITHGSEGSEAGGGLNVIEEYDEQLMGPGEQDLTETERLREQGRKQRNVAEDDAVRREREAQRRRNEMAKEYETFIDKSGIKLGFEIIFTEVFEKKIPQDQIFPYTIARLR
jgi:hypothetical protein